MRFKITEIAKTELDSLDQSARRRVLDGIRTEIPTSWQSDKVLRFTAAPGADVRAHRLPDGPVVLYRLMDVDGDQRDDVVVLQLVDRDAFAPDPLPEFMALAPHPNGVGGASRLGRELLEQISDGV